MALIIINEPPVICLNDNDILLKIQKDNFIPGNIYSFAIIGFTAIPANNDSFRIYSDNFDITFTFKTTPDNSGLQLPINFATVEEFQTALEEALNENFDIFTNCDIEFYQTDPSDVSGVRFLNKLPGDFNYGIEIITCSVGSIYHADGGVPSGITINCIADGNILALQPGLDEMVEFNLKGLFELSGGFTYPETSTTPVLWSNFCKLFNIKYYETEGNANSKLFTLQKYICMGGIDKKTLAYLADEETTWIAYITANMKFLTWRPRDIIVDASSVVKLYILHQTVNAKLVWRYNDDPETDQEGDLIVPDMATVYEYIVSPSKLYDSATLPNIWKISVWLALSNNTVISEVKNMYLDWTYNEFRREFIFANSYIGAYDTFRFTGKAETNLELENYIVNKIAYDSELKTIEQSRSIISETFKASTGWINEQTLHYLDEFLHSEDRYEIINGRLYPVYLLSSKIFRKKDGENLYSLEIEYARSFKEEFYSDILDVSQVSYNQGNTTQLPEYANGHIIVDRNNTVMPQRKKLKFTGSGVTVTDDEANNQTIVHVANTGLRQGISMDHVNATPPSTTTIATYIDLRTAVDVGDLLEIEQDGVFLDYFVTQITNNLITVTGNVLDTELSITRVRFIKTTGTTLSQQLYTLDRYAWDFLQSQELTVPGVHENSFVIVSPATGLTNLNNYIDAGIRGGAQTENTVKIFCETVPGQDINILITWLWD